MYLIKKSSSFFQLKPDGWKENRQFLAKSCIHLKDYSAALHWLDQANELPVKNPDVSFSCQKMPPKKRIFKHFGHFGWLPKFVNKLFSIHV